MNFAPRRRWTTMCAALRLRHKEVLTGVCLLLVGFGWLAAAEAALRLQQFVAFGGISDVEASDKYHIDPVSGLRLPVPGSQHGPVGINSLGFRGPELDMPKPDGRLRIAFLGSSVTFDPYVKSFASTWPSRTVAAMATELPGCSIDLVNAGVPGLGTASIEKQYRVHVAATQPDVAVIWTSGLNLAVDGFAKSQGLAGVDHYKPSLLAEHSLFWSKIEKNGVVIQRQRAAFSEVGKVDLGDADITRAYRHELARVVETVRGSGAEPVLLSHPGWLRADQTPAMQLRAAETALFYMPYLSIGSLIAAVDGFDAATRETAAELGVTVLDWRPHVEPTPAHFVDSIHLSPTGAAALGDWLGGRLAARVTASGQGLELDCNADAG